MFAQDPVSPPPTPTSATQDPTLPAETNFESFDVVIYNQVGIVFKGEAKALASANSQGEFSILPGHTNFISLITQPILLYPKEGQTKKFEVGLGVIRVLHNQVQIFTGLLVSQESAELAKLQAKPEQKRSLLNFSRRTTAAQ